MNQQAYLLIAFVCGVGLGTVPSYWFRKRVRYKDHVVEIRNNLFGWETVLLDERVIVSRFAFGGTYTFMIDDDYAEVRIHYRWHLLGARIRFFVNDRAYYDE